MWLSLFLIIADRNISSTNVERERHEAERADSTERRLNIDHLMEEPRWERVRKHRMNLQKTRVYF